jgi:hypothetical protein
VNHRQQWLKIVGVSAVALSLTLAGCGAKQGDSAGTGEESPQGTAANNGGSNGSALKFGDMKSPCGKDFDGKKATINAAENGGDSKELLLSVANERSSTIRAGLLKELWDASVGFAKWCNDQGGIAGVPIKLVDTDGQVLQVEAAMAKACNTFALVGGGWVQDQLAFSKKDGSDFHKCKLIAFPGFAVSPQFAGANGVVESLVNAANNRAVSWLKQLVRLYPEEMKKTAIVWGTLPTIENNGKQNSLAMAKVPGIGRVADVSYAAVGQVDWDLVTQQVKQNGATAINFIGEPDNFAKFSASLKAQGWKGPLVGEVNHYDDVLLKAAGPDAVDGIMLRVAGHPFEEADKWPAMKDLIAMIKAGSSDAKIAGLSMQSISQWLLFVTSANDCIKTSGGELSRKCVYDAAKTVGDWDGGGLHGPAKPLGTTSPRCSLLMQVQGGKFVRLDPVTDTKAADGDQIRDGFYCTDSVDIAGDYGKGDVDPSTGY